MVFEWNDKKNKINFEKHGISFEEASHIFDGDILTWQDTRKDYQEIRQISVGSLGEILVIIVVHTDRKGLIRIISARKANKKERRLYHEHLKTTS